MITLQKLGGGELGTPEFQAIYNKTVGGIRGGKVTLNGANPTPIAFKADTVATILGTDNGATKNLGNGKTLIVSPDGGGDNTVTFAATAATSVSAASPSADISGGTDNKFMISVDGDEAEEVELTVAALDSGAAIASAMETAIQALDGKKAAVTVAFDSVYTITSGTLGTGSSVVITDAAEANVAEALKLGAANDGVETAGTGDFVDAAAATPAEVAAAINKKAAGWTATAEGNKIRITSPTAGKDSSLVVNAGSTADEILGITGSAYGAQGLGYDTDMVDANYLALATLNGVASASLADAGLSITGRTAAGFQVECETAAAADAVDVLILGVPA